MKPAIAINRSEIDAVAFWDKVERNGLSNSGRKLTGEDVEQIVNALDVGKGHRAIARAMGISKSTVSRIAAKRRSSEGRT